MQLHKITKLPAIDIAAVFVFLWTVGLSMGLYLGKSLCVPLSALLRDSCLSKSTFLIPSAVVPITLVWIVSKHKLPGLIFPVAFCKALLDGLLLPGIGAAFGSASWLMGSLVFFSDRVATVFLIYFSVKCLLGLNCNKDRMYVSLLVLIIAVIAVDYFYISCNLIYLMS